MLRYLKNEKGSALVVVLIALVVLVTLGSAFIFFSTNERMRAIKQEQEIQAHYIARSGAEAVAKSIIDQSVNVDDLIEKTAVNPATGNLEDGEFEVNVTRNTNKLIITSKGMVSDSDDTVVLTLIKKSPFDMGIKTKETIELTDDSLVYGGDIGTNLTEDEHISEAGEIDQEKIIDGNAYYDIEADFPEFIQPEGTLTSDMLKVEESTVTLSQREDPYIYNEVKVEEGSIVFDTGSGDLVVVVNGAFKVEESGSIKVEGSGRLLLYAESIKFEDTAESSMSDTSECLFFVSGKGSELVKLENFSVFNGAIYAPDTTVKFEDSIILTGSIVAEKIIAEDDIEIHYESTNDGGLFEGNTGYKKDSWNTL